MIKRKDELTKEKTEKISEMVKNYVDEMDKLSDSEHFTIDNIEKIWGELEDSTKQIYKEINSEIIEQLNERKIIQEKKGVLAERSDVEKR